MLGLELGEGGGFIATTSDGILRLIFLAKNPHSSLADSVADRDKCFNGGHPAFQLPQGGTRTALSMVVPLLVAEWLHSTPQLVVLLIADYNYGNRLLVAANSDHGGLLGSIVSSFRPHIFNWTSLHSSAILLDRVMRVHPNL